MQKKRLMSIGFLLITVALISVNCKKDCGSDSYPESDGDTILCRPCSSICSSTYQDTYCMKKCKNYIPPTIPSPSHAEESSVPIIGVVIGVIGVAVVIGVIFWIKRRREKEVTSSNNHGSEYQQISNNNQTNIPHGVEETRIPLTEQTAGSQEGNGKVEFPITTDEMDMNGYVLGGDPIHPIRDI